MQNPTLEVSKETKTSYFHSKQNFTLKKTAGFLEECVCFEENATLASES